MTKVISIWLIIIAIYFTINSLLLLNSPSIWPDEAEYADIAVTILHQKKFYSPLQPNLTPNDKTIFWYPPLMGYFFAGLFKVFGFSIVTLRMAAVFSGFIFLLLVYILMYRLARRLAFVPIFLLLFDFFFMRATRIARPEIFIMMQIAAAIVVVVNFKNWWGTVAAGVFIGAAVLFQPFGGVLGAVFMAILLVFKNKKIWPIIKSLFLFGLPITLCLFWWLKIIDFNFWYLKENMKLQGLRKTLEQNYFQQIGSDPNLWYKSLLIILFAGSVYLIFLSLVKGDYQTKNKVLSVVGLMCLALWLFIFIGKQFWYFAYIAPFVYVFYFLVIDSIFISERNKLGLTTLLTCLFIFITFVINIRFNLYVFSSSFDNNSYQRFAKSVAQNIPPGSSVLINAIPDPYFELKKNPTLRLRHFIGLPNLKKQYLEALQNSDYVVYTGLMDYVYGDFLDTYLKKNAEWSQLIDSGPGGYRGFIIRLKPLESRQY